MENDKNFTRWLYAYGLVAFIGILAFSTVFWAMSFLLGYITSVFTYRLMTLSVLKSLNRPEGTRLKYVMSQQMMRFAIYFVILLGAAFVDNIEIILTFIGMLSVKIVMFVYILLKKEGNE